MHIDYQKKQRVQEKEKVSLFYYILQIFSLFSYHLVINKKFLRTYTTKKPCKPGKRKTSYNTNNQHITPKTKAKKKSLSRTFFSSLFLQFPYKVIKRIANRQQQFALHTLLRLRNSIGSHIRNQYYYFFNRILINTLLPSSSIFSACFRILGSSEVSQASNSL